MATKSFLKNIVIKDKECAKKLVLALENAEKKGRKKVTIDVKSKQVSDRETIRKMFGV